MGRGTVRRRCQAGSLSLEMVILTPVLLACLLTIAGGARYVEARAQVSAAASIAARAASLETDPGTAATAGHRAAARALAERGRSCADLEVGLDVSGFQPGGQVRAVLTCTADLSDLVGFGLPGQRTFRATALVPLESHRVL